MQLDTLKTTAARGTSHATATRAETPGAFGQYREKSPQSAGWEFTTKTTTTILETEDQDITFYTDESAAGGNCLGGGGVVEYEIDREPHELSYPARRWTSPYQAELTAIEHALTMATDKPEQKKIRIRTDSRSAVQRLESLIHNNKPDTRTEKYPGAVTEDVT